jgi:oligo-1,6-glucosidase
VPAGSPWWKDAVVYQIYPRSFADSNGDGIGDLRGVIDHVDHLVELGIDCVWLSPHFDSPNHDNGYDIRDYRKVMAEFGTMADFDELLAVLTAHGIRLVLDLVVNHTSDEHEWFVASRSDPLGPYRDFYIWRDGVDGGPPNNYPAFFGGSAWERDDASGQWYLHYFAPQQPDLNWEHPQVRAEVYDLMRFWLDKGVAGFRMDVIPFISKQPGVPDLVGDQRRAPQDVYASGPRVHEFLHEMYVEVLEPYDAVSIGEAFGVGTHDAHLFTDSERGELSMIFHFDLMRLGRRHWRDDGWTVPGFKKVLRDIDAASGPRGWNTSFLCNHDNPRAVSRFGDPSAEWRERSATALATVSLLQRATPFVYQGDELGMTNFPFTSIERYDDVEVKGLWRAFVDTGRVPADELLAHLARTSRDHARTPMQWSAGDHGGFTTGTPWLAVNPNHAEVNAAEQRARPGSVFHHYRRLIELRRAEPALVHGEYLDLLPDHPQVLLFARSLDRRRFIVAVNLGTESQLVDLPAEVAAVGVAYSNTEGNDAPLDGGRLHLDGWQSLVLSAG